MMKFEEKFNEICKFDEEESYEPGSPLYELEMKRIEFEKEYSDFKKAHNLENLYFANIEKFETDGYHYTITYCCSDLYLTFLQANNLLPRGVGVPCFPFQEVQLHNSYYRSIFDGAMMQALERKGKVERKENYVRYLDDNYKGIDVIIKVEPGVNGMPSQVVDIRPMDYEDLIIKN